MGAVEKSKKSRKTAQILNNKKSQTPDSTRTQARLCLMRTNIYEDSYHIFFSLTGFSGGLISRQNERF